MVEEVTIIPGKHDEAAKYCGNVQECQNKVTKKDRGLEPVEILPQPTTTNIQAAEVKDIPETLVVVDGKTYYVSTIACGWLAGWLVGHIRTRCRLNTGVTKMHTICKLRSCVIQGRVSYIAYYTYTYIFSVIYHKQVVYWRGIFSLRAFTCVHVCLRSKVTRVRLDHQVNA